ncbi:MAG TPA: SdpI family protein [Chloroflexota bacterium]|nr:SdpI family protein [Chloroflexota bacterium]
MRITWKTEWPNWVLILGMFVMAGLSWASAPDRIPVHWNISGQVDRYGGKVEGLLAIPLITLSTYILLILTPLIDPGRANYERFAGVYSLIRTLLTVLFAAIYAVVLLWVRGYQVDVSAIIPIAIGAFFIIIGNYMGKIRPNWFVGIRTPWTISSKRSWTKTHRLGGWIFILMGLVLILSGVVRTEWAAYLSFAVIIGGVIWTFVYSYLVWRNDPDRIPPSGTLPG